MLLVAALLLAALLLAACNLTTYPEVWTPLDPPAYYLTWWDEAVECSGRVGRHGPFALLEWRLAPGPWPSSSREGFAVGAQDGNVIYIAAGYEDTDWVVKHEMLHALGFDHGTKNHAPYGWPFEPCATSPY